MPDETITIDGLERKVLYHFKLNEKSEKVPWKKSLPSEYAILECDKSVGGIMVVVRQRISGCWISGYSIPSLDLNCLISGLVDDLSAAKAIIVTLPKTADGVPITLGMRVWAATFAGSIRMNVFEMCTYAIKGHMVNGHTAYFIPNEVYSTFDLAHEASQKLGYMNAPREEER